MNNIAKNFEIPLGNDDFKKESLTPYVPILHQISFNIEKPEEIDYEKRTYFHIKKTISLPLHVFLLPIDLFLLFVGLYDMTFNRYLTMGTNSPPIEADAAHFLLEALILRKINFIQGYENKLHFLCFAIHDLQRQTFNPIPQELRAYLLEKELLKHIPKLNKQLFSDLEDLKFSFARTTQLCDVYDEWINNVICIHQLRQKIIRTKGIGVVGTAKTGKSTFLNLVLQKKNFILF